MGVIRHISKRLIEGVLPRDVILSSGKGRGISLTFDDGPHPTHTPALLDNLASAEIRGTFFIVGERAEQHRAIVRRIADEGHELANHTWTHSEPSETSRHKFLDEVRRTQGLIEDTTGEACRLVRPPKGELSLGKLAGLMSTRQTVVLWNQDTRDYRMQSSAEMRDWCESYMAHGGDIVLMHDNHPHAVTAAALFGTLPQFSGLEFRTVSEWLTHRPKPRAVSSIAQRS